MIFKPFYRFETPKPAGMDDIMRFNQGRGR